MNYGFLPWFYHGFDAGFYHFPMDFPNPRDFPAFMELVASTLEWVGPGITRQLHVHYVILYIHLDR